MSMEISSNYKDYKNEYLDRVQTGQDNTDTEELVDMKERKAIYDKSMEPIAAGDVVVKFPGRS